MNGLMRKKYDPNQMGMMMGPEIEKSSGDPLLDKVSVTMAEHRHTRQISERLEKMLQLLCQPGATVRLHLGLQIDSGEMTHQEMREYLLEDRPELVQAFEDPDGESMRKLFEDQIDEAIKSGNNRREEHLQVDFEIPIQAAKVIVREGQAHAPKPDSAKAAQALRALADKVASE